MKFKLWYLIVFFVAGSLGMLAIDRLILGSDWFFAFLHALSAGIGALPYLIIGLFMLFVWDTVEEIINEQDRINTTHSREISRLKSKLIPRKRRRFYG